MIGELICGILKSYKLTYLQNRNKTTDVENKHGCQGEVQGRENWEIRTDIYTTIYKRTN